MYGTAQNVGKHKGDTICGSKAMYVANATGSQTKSLAGDVRPRKTCTSNMIRTGIVLVTGVIPATKVTGIHTEETGILIHPMQARD
jgi:hypothetical protein